MFHISPLEKQVVVFISLQRHQIKVFHIVKQIRVIYDYVLFKFVYLLFLEARRKTVLFIVLLLCLSLRYNRCSSKLLLTFRVSLPHCYCFGRQNGHEKLPQWEKPSSFSTPETTAFPLRGKAPVVLAVRFPV